MGTPLRHPSSAVQWVAGQAGLEVRREDQTGRKQGFNRRHETVKAVNDWGRREKEKEVEGSSDCQHGSPCY